MLPINLAEINKPGQYTVANIDGEGSAIIQLKRLRICKNQMIELVQCGNPLIVRVAGAEIGISRGVVGCVFVKPVEQ